MCATSPQLQSVVFVVCLEIKILFVCAQIFLLTVHVSRCKVSPIDEHAVQMRNTLHPDAPCSSVVARLIDLDLLLLKTANLLLLLPRTERALFHVR